MEEESQKIIELREKLQKIGWDIKGRYPNTWIYDHENKITHYRVMSDRVEFENTDEHTNSLMFFGDPTFPK